MKVKVLIDQCNLSTAIMTGSQLDFFLYIFPSVVLPSVSMGFFRLKITRSALFQYCMEKFQAKDFFKVLLAGLKPFNTCTNRVNK